MEALVEAAIAVGEAGPDHDAAAAADGDAPVIPAPLLPPLNHLNRSRLTELERWTVVVLSRKGYKYADIAEEVQCGTATVKRVVKRWRLNGSPGSGSRIGRPRITDEQTDTGIAVAALIDRFTSPRQIKRKLILDDVSQATVRRRLNEAGLFGRVARQLRIYTVNERNNRKSFAHQYKDWTADQWKKVLFSDEKCFYGKGFCGRTWVQRPPGQALNPDYVQHKIAHPVKVNVWGCFCAAGVGYCYIFNETMDAPLMKHALETHMLPSARLHFSTDPPEQWYLLHDNDKKFKSRLVTQWLHNNGISLIDFPPYSPDLNPIENLWAVMQRRVDTHSCETMEELQDAIAAEWAKIDKELLEKLVESMPQRCRAVIEADGWYTQY